ncbi:MAG: acylglycerol kinase family protein [Opitutaceae bacterium]|nr:acylglycerol kinase family protein [Opitutaceae bacterium]
MKLALIHNPQGGYNRRHGPVVPALARQAGIPCWELIRPGDAAAAMPAIAQSRPDLLIVNGGDSTVDSVIASLRQAANFETEPMLALLPGGTTNMIARDVGLDGPPERALRRLLSAIAAGTPGMRVDRAPLMVRRADGSADLHGFFLGGGALPCMLRKVQQGLHARGFVGRGGETMALLQATGRMLFGDIRRDPLLAPRLLGWTADRAAKESEPVVLYFVTTLDRLVLGINSSRPAPSLRFLALRHPYRNIMGSVASLLRRKPFAALGRNFVFRESRSLTLNLEGEAVLDGEMVPLASGPVTLGLELAKPFTFWRI